MNEYEMLYIVTPRRATDEVPGVIDWVNGLVAQGDGEVLAVDNWGKRRFAYPIAHEFEGTYVYMTVRLSPDSTRALESALVISEDIVRHLLIRGIIPSDDRARATEARQDSAVAVPAAPEPTTGGEPAGESKAASADDAQAAESPAAEAAPEAGPEKGAEGAPEQGAPGQEPVSETAEPSPATAGAE